MKIEVASCVDCPFFEPGGDYQDYCSADKRTRDIGWNVTRDEPRPDWCPLPVEVLVQGWENEP